MSEHENAPAAPPKGVDEWVKELQAASEARLTRDQLLLLYREAKESHHQMANTLATEVRARKDAQAEAERLRGERADLQHKLAHWQRVAEESGTMVARRVEAMLRYAIACLTEPDDDRKAVYDQILAGFRALPATPAPGPSEEAEDIRAQCLLPVISAKHEAEAKGFEADAAYLDAIIRQIRAIPLGDVQPGPSAEGPWTVESESEVLDSTGELSRWWYVTTPGREPLGNFSEAEARAVAAALNALTRAPGGQDVR